MNISRYYAAVNSGIKFLYDNGAEWWADQLSQEKDLTIKARLVMVAVQAVQNGEDIKQSIAIELKYKSKPVGVREFVCSDEYLGKEKEVYPLVMDEIEEMNKPQYSELVLTGGIGPVSADTEFLTPSGWVRMDEYKEGMRIAEYNHDTKTVKFAKPLGYEVRNAEKFIEVETPLYSMHLSNLHRVPYVCENGGEEVLQVETAQIVAQRISANKMPMGAYIPTTYQAHKTKPHFKNKVDLYNYLLITMVCETKRIPDSKKERTAITDKCAGVALFTLCSQAHVKNIKIKKGRYSFKYNKKYKGYEWVYKLSQQELVEVYNVIKTYSTKYMTKEKADAVQYIYSTQGISTHVTTNLYGWQVNVLDNSNADDLLSNAALNTVEAIGNKMYCFVTNTSYFIARRKGKVFVTGNSAKTTCALYTIAYQLYLMSCLRNPNQELGIDTASEIELIFQSINKGVAEKSYDRFRKLIESSTYFKNNFMYDKNLESMLKFPHRIEIKPISGNETAAIGGNVIGGLIDELNYMAKTSKSAKSIDGGNYDQALALYNSIARRRKSRFVKNGEVLGKLCLVSSRRYPNQFTDIKEKEAETDPTIYVYDKRVWEIKPEGSYSGEMFKVFKGDEARKPRVLEDYEVVEFEEEELIGVPIEYRSEFDKDLINSLREIAGVSTLATHPFLIDVEKVNAGFGTHESIFSAESCDFINSKVAIYPKRFYKPEIPRYVHIDLAVTGDSAGFAIGCCTGFTNRQSLGGAFEWIPQIRMDGILEIKPPKGGEILFHKIRELIHALYTSGLNIKWISFDTYQSRDSIQLLRQAGFMVGTLSLDTSSLPYDTMKTIIYSDCFSAPVHEKCRYELITLEKDTSTGKIDHPPVNGSKDTADATGGVCFGLYSRREVWSMYKIPMTARLPTDRMRSATQQEKQA